jgi:hypothetical protein
VAEASFAATELIAPNRWTKMSGAALYFAEAKSSGLSSMGVPCGVRSAA